jgi:[acyl-carrier-protein] S-malonyltransferase
VETIGHITTEYGIDTVFECGPGKVLTALNKRIDKALSCSAVYSPETLQQALASVVSK